MMTLVELRAAEPLLHDLLVEACAGRAALATALVDGIAKLAADRALTAERERVSIHLRLGDIAGREVAIEAIKSGAHLAECQDAYLGAAKERGQAPALRLIAKETT